MSDAENLLDQARIHHEGGRLEVAEPLYRAVLAINTIQSEAHHGLGALLLEQGKHADALRHLKRSVELSPETSRYWEAWALGLLVVHSPEAAMEVVEQAFKLGFNTPSMIDLHEQILAALKNQADQSTQNQEYYQTTSKDEKKLNSNKTISRLRTERFKKKNFKRKSQKVIPVSKLSRNDFIDAINSFIQLGQWVQTETLSIEFIKRFPNDAFGYKVYGTLLVERHEFAKSISILERAIELEPNVAAFNNLGFALQKLNRFDEALSAYQNALAVDPEKISAHTLNGIATMWHALNQYDKAIDFYRKAISIKPDLASAYNNLGALLKNLGRLNEALACFNRCAQIEPSYFSAVSNKSSIFQEFSKIDEALACCRLSIEKDTYRHSIVSYSNYLFILNYHPEKSAEEIFLDYKGFEETYNFSSLCNFAPYLSQPETDRILRIGYVSPDFKDHPVSLFLEPLLQWHDKSRFQVIAYSENAKPDYVTNRYKSYVNEWVETRGLTDDEVATRIRADAVDILINIAGHSADNRLGVFARKPAPVSLSWWMGFIYTSGLTAIDYFLGDDVITPEGSEHLFSEQIWRMEAPSFVYRPAEGMGDVGPLPALTRGYVTFGVLSRGIRINHHTVRCWSKILTALPSSRLVVDSRSFRSNEVCEDLIRRFGEHGIGAERLEVGFHTPPWDILRGIDIMFDCFPHNSGTTLCESIYMGVPFVTLADRPSVGRVGSEILVGMGHPEWIATTQEHYVSIALDLAGDLERLASIRARLRAEMEASPLRDEPGFARRMEQVYRRMWQGWCATAMSEGSVTPSPTTAQE